MVSLKNPKVLIFYLLLLKKRGGGENKLELLSKKLSTEKNEGKGGREGGREDNICLPIESVRISQELCFVVVVQITPLEGGPMGPKSTLFFRKYFSSLAKMCLP